MNIVSHKAGVFNLLSSRVNLHLSYNPAGRSHCRLQNHHGYIRHHHRGMGGSPGDIGEVPMTQVKQWKDCSWDVGKAAEGLAPPHSPTLTSLHLCHSSFSHPSAALPTSQLILQPFHGFTYVIGTSPTSQLIIQHFCRFTYVTAHSTTLPLFHLRHSHFTYYTWRAAHRQGDEKTVCGGLACYSKLLSLEVATVLDSC